MLRMSVTAARGSRKKSNFAEKNSVSLSVLYFLFIRTNILIQVDIYTEMFPMTTLNLKPTHKPVKAYYESLQHFESIGVSHEIAVRSAFQTLLEYCGRSLTGSSCLSTQ